MLLSSAVILRAEALAQPSTPPLLPIQPRRHADHGDHGEDRDHQHDHHWGIHEYLR